MDVDVRPGIERCIHAHNRIVERALKAERQGNMVERNELMSEARRLESHIDNLRARLYVREG